MTGRERAWRWSADRQIEPDLDEPTPCATCGLPDIIDGDNPAAHWNTPAGHTIVAWTCSKACQDALEKKRGVDGVLTIEGASS